MSELTNIAIIITGLLLNLQSSCAQQNKAGNESYWKLVSINQPANGKDKVDNAVTEIYNKAVASKLMVKYNNNNRTVSISPLDADDRKEVSISSVLNRPVYQFSKDGKSMGHDSLTYIGMENGKFCMKTIFVNKEGKAATGQFTWQFEAIKKTNFGQTTQKPQKKESMTAAGDEYLQFDTAQRAAKQVLIARQFKSDDYKLLNLVGEPKSVAMVIYNYLEREQATELFKGIVWGTKKVINCTLLKGEISQLNLITYAILTAPKIPVDGYSYYLSDYTKGNVKLSEVNGRDAFVIEFFDYGLYLNKTGKLQATDGYFNFLYNEKGDCIKAVHDERQFIYRYRYDNKGNWTQRIMWDSDHGVIQKIDRTITY